VAVARLWREKILAVPMLPVQLVGEWSMEETPRLSGGVAISRRWNGRASASQPLVALAILASPRLLQWGKSEASTDPEGCPIALALLPNDNVGLDVQVNIVAGGGGYRRATTKVSSVDYLPPIASPREVPCGKLVVLTTVKGMPVIEVGLILLPRESVRKGRTGNWKLRSLEPAMGLLARMIDGPRSGSLNTAD
jgi:hypothetical protein